MHQALKRFGFLLQIFLLVFCLTAHALALDPSDASPMGLADRIANSAEAQPDWLSSRPEVVNPSDFTTEKPLLAEAGPFEKEEEEEVHTPGISFKDSPAPGSGSSAFFCAQATAPPGLLTAYFPADRRSLARFTSTRKHILLQVFRI